MKVQKLADVGLSVNQFLVSLILIVIGFTTYYFIPLSFSKGKISIMFLLLNLILVMVVIGLTFLSTLVTTALERLILWLTLHTCCRRDKKMYPIIVSNMDAHSKRNNKTSIIFSMSIAFLIFSASSFELLSTVI